MRGISKKAFLRTALVICIVGVAALAVFYSWASRDYYQRHQPTSLKVRPSFLYPIEIDGFGPITNPLAVVVAGGNLYIAADGRVAVTSREGYPKWSLKLADKTKNNEGLSPRAVALDRFGHIYVSTGSKKNRIFVYGADGEFKYFFPRQTTPGVGTGSSRSRKVVNPVGLNYAGGHLYVTDVGDQTVKVFSSAGELKRKIGGPGIAPAMFQYPNATARADDGTIYVADSNNSRVQVFNKKGRYLSLLKPPEKEKFSLPRGLAFDRLGRIHVVDTLKSRVFVFSPDHRFLFTYGSGQKNESNLAYPNGIFIDRDTGLIFIADRLNNRVVVWAQK